MDAFPLAREYTGRCRPAAPRVREGIPSRPGAGFAYTERHLQCVWADSAWRPAALRTAGGEPLAVEDPGRWNLEAGPDFLDAALRIGPERRRVQGDVEIHVHASDWVSHRHAEDSAYAGVVAHVTYYPGALAPPALRPGVVQISLRDALRADPAFSFENIDLTAYPYATLNVSRPPCAEALASWTPADVAAFLEAAGEERLRLKSHRLALAAAELGADQVFYEEVLGALGYKHNRLPCRALARRLPLARLRETAGRDVLRAYALLLGVAGLLPAATLAERRDEATLAMVRQLWDQWWKLQAEFGAAALPRSAWRLAGVRPANHPARRLAAAAVLFADGQDRLARLRELSPATPREWFRDAGAVLDAADPWGYWRRRASFSAAPGEADVALIGAGRLSAILANVVLPLRAAEGADVSALLPHLPAEDENALVRRTAYLLLGRDVNPALYRTGLRQQGFLQVFHDFCLSRTGCPRCLLPAALRGSGPPQAPPCQQAVSARPQ